MSMGDTGVGTEKPQKLTVPVAGRSIWISTTSPSMISVSSLVGQTAQSGSDWPGTSWFSDQDDRQAEWISYRTLT